MTPGCRLPGSMRPAKLVGERLSGSADRPFGVRVGVNPPGVLPNEGGGGGGNIMLPACASLPGVRGMASGAAAKDSSMAAMGAASFDRLSPKMLSLFRFVSGTSPPIIAASGFVLSPPPPWPSNAGNGCGPADEYGAGSGVWPISAASGFGCGAGVGRGDEEVVVGVGCGGVTSTFNGPSAGIAGAGAGVGANGGGVADVGGEEGMASELDIGENGKSIDGMEANVPPDGRLGARGGKEKGVAPADACCGAPPPPPPSSSGVDARPASPGVPGIVARVGVINVFAFIP